MINLNQVNYTAESSVLLTVTGVTLIGFLCNEVSGGKFVVPADNTSAIKECGGIGAQSGTYKYITQSRQLNQTTLTLNYTAPGLVTSVDVVGTNDTLNITINAPTNVSLWWVLVGDATVPSAQNIMDGQGGNVNSAIYNGSGWASSTTSYFHSLNTTNTTKNLKFWYYVSTNVTQPNLTFSCWFMTLLPSPTWYSVSKSVPPISGQMTYGPALAYEAQGPSSGFTPSSSSTGPSAAASVAPSYLGLLLVLLAVFAR